VQKLTIRLALSLLIAISVPSAYGACNDPVTQLPRPCPVVLPDELLASTADGDDPAPPAEKSQSPDRRDQIFYPGDTERLKPLGKKLLLNILLDEKEIFTSPFRMNRHTAPIWIVSAATVGGLIAADHHIADSFSNSNGQVRWGGRISNIGAAQFLVPIIASYYGYGVWRDHAKAREIGVLGTEALIDSLLTVAVLKEVFQRNRPDEPDPGKFWGGGLSFPSGHAIQMWSIASLIAHEYHHRPVVAVTAYSLAAIVSASRIAARQHFASDIVAGGTMGWFIGRYVYQTHMSHLAHKHSFLVPLIVPQFEPSQRRAGFTIVFGGNSGSSSLAPFPPSPFRGQIYGAAYR